MRSQELVRYSERVDPLLPAGCHAHPAAALEQQLPPPAAPGGAGARGHV